MPTSPISVHSYPAAKMAALKVATRLRSWVMPPNRAWNAAGPAVPLWFRRRLRRIDPQLVLQFIPPSRDGKAGGVNPQMCPRGAWAICRRMRKTRFLFKRWVMGLTDSKGNPVRPTMALVHVIKVAKMLWRKGRVDRLEGMLDDHIQKTRYARASQKRDQRLQDVSDLMSKVGWGMTAPRVFIPASQRG